MTFLYHILYGIEYFLTRDYMFYFFLIPGVAGIAYLGFNLLGVHNHD